MERGKFEESWKNAFDKADVSPSDKVWTNVELDLEKAKGSHLKGRLIFYQMLAAASVIFSIAIGSFGLYFQSHKPDSGNTAAQQAPSNNPGPVSSTVKSNTDQHADSISNLSVKPGISILPSGKERNDSYKQNTAIASSTLQQDRKKNFSNTVSVDIPKDLSGIPMDFNKDEIFKVTQFYSDNKILPPFYPASEINLHIRGENVEFDPVVALLASLY